MAEISIIVPVYKTEAYLERCIDSILKQSFRDFELILVDDGSPDRCGEICDAYAIQDARVKVIHKKNGGVSSARNRGMELATGRYIMFCDSDDFVMPNWCQCLCDGISCFPDAWILCDVFRSEKNDCYTLYIQEQMQFSEITFYELYEKNIVWYPVNKIYRSDIIAKNKLEFPENYVLGEDMYFNLQYLKYCSQIRYCNGKMYVYCYNDESATSQIREDKMEHLLRIFADVFPYIPKEKLSDYCDGWLYRFVGFLQLSTLKGNFSKKYRYNNSMMKSKEFLLCIENASASKNGRVFLNMLRLQNYGVFICYQIIWKAYKRMKTER